MSMLLFIIGGVAVMIGAATIAFGMPINEFSFGNTLIVSGTTIGSAGLVVIALAAAVAQLQRVAQALAEHAPQAHPTDTFEAPPAHPFPPKTRPAAPPAPPAFEPHAFEPPPPLRAEPPPSLRNPEAPPPTVEEEVSLSPPFGNGTRAGLGEPPPAPPASAPVFEAPWRPTPPPPPPEVPSTNFEAMWPARDARPPAAEPVAEFEPPAAPPPRAETPAPPPPRSVAVLKSGVVDGMAYTLYVDGSIEAELSQGTLRFGSIDELRAYLEKKS